LLFEEQREHEEREAATRGADAGWRPVCVNNRRKTGACFAAMSRSHRRTHQPIDLARREARSRVREMFFTRRYPDGFGVFHVERRLQFDEPCP